MQTAQFKTDLRCASCVQKIAHYLDGDKSISNWSVDIDSPDKVLTVTGASLNHAHIQELMKKAGYRATPIVYNLKSARVETPPNNQTYFPLILIFVYLVAGVFLSAIRSQSWNLDEMMENFMGGFFIVFSFFKMLNLKGFAEAYASYDVVAKRWTQYGYVYPFIELFLGMGYLLRLSSIWINIATIIVMGISSLGVIQSLMKKQKIQCACLGTVFNLPMSSVTLVEDLLMVLMAAFSLAAA
jgi:hypothetical protein